jgi:hypothetical protein
MDTNDTIKPETQPDTSQARCAVPICSACCENCAGLAEDRDRADDRSLRARHESTKLREALKAIANGELAPWKDAQSLARSALDLPNIRNQPTP